MSRALRRAGKAGWREVPDWAYGEGDRYPTGGLVHTAASVLLEVARTLPVGVDHMDAKTRGQILRDAAVGSLYAFVVGRSGFDDDTRWWAVSSGSSRPEAALRRHLRRSEPAVEDPSDHDRCRASGLGQSCCV